MKTYVCKRCKLEYEQKRKLFVTYTDTCGDCEGIIDARLFYASEDAVLTLVID